MNQESRTLATATRAPAQNSMVINTEARIELIVSDDDGRKPITHPYLRQLPTGENKVERWEIVATNGRMMVHIPVIVDCGDTPGWVSTEALVEGRKAAKKKHKSEYSVLCNGACVLEDGRSYPRPFKDDDMKYPDVDAVQPKDATKYAIAFDPRYLADIARSMNAQFVTLRIVDELNVIQVTPSGHGHAIGARALLMPARLS